MAQLLLGKEVNEAINARVKRQTEELEKRGIVPTLRIIRVGEKESDLSYERGALKKCESLGIRTSRALLPENVSQTEMMETIADGSENSAIHGVLMFRPLPKHLDQNAIMNALAPSKDVDCMTDLSMSGVFTGKSLGFPPCTAQAVMEVLDHYGIDPKGKRAVVIGRSLVIGRPVAMMLMQKNATVTICHTKTVGMPAIAREADILIVAAGHARTVGRDYVREGQVVIDVGINVDANGKLCGDVDFEAAEPIVSAITPVPRGVGSVTTSVLAAHVAEAALRTAASL